MKKTWILIYLFALFTVAGCCLVCQAADPQARARAALALAAAQKVGGGWTCPGCGNSCYCTAGDCGASGCPTAGNRHAKTAKADDGGPDWTWDEKKGDWYRVIPLTSPATSVPPPVFYQPPAVFVPQPVMPRMMSFGGGGGSRRGC